MAKKKIQNVHAPQPAEAVPPRAARFPNVMGLDRDLSPTLDELDAWVIGAGSVGEPICTHLARLQPRSLTIVDPGVYKPENLLTQDITPEAIACNKVEYVGLRCAQISPKTRVRVFAGRAEELPLAALCSAGIVFVATDNLAAEVEIAQRCLHAGRPLIQASVCGELLVAEVRFCSHGDAAGPCLACGYGRDEWTRLQERTIYSCQGVWSDSHSLRPANPEPTRSTSSLCSLAAHLALMQILRFFGGLGASVIDTNLQYCAFTHGTTVSPLTRNASCPLEHTSWDRCRTQRELAAYTPRELANIAIGHFRTTRGISLTIDDLNFVETGACGRCGTQQPVDEFVETLRTAHRCSECGGAVEALPFGTHRPVPLAVLRKWIDRPLREVNSTAPESIVVRGPGAAVVCEFSGAPPFEQTTTSAHDN